jgi:hypothetical protein
VAMRAVGNRRLEGEAEAEAERAPTRRLGVRVVAGPWLVLLIGRGRTWGRTSPSQSKTVSDENVAGFRGVGHFTPKRLRRSVVGQAQLRQVPIRSSR